MGVTHIVIHPTSRLTLLLSRRVLSRAPPRAAFSGACSRAAAAAAPRARARRRPARVIAICPRAAARRFSRQMQPHFPAHAAAPPSRRPRRGPLAAPDWLCSGRQWPQPLLLLPPARGPYGWTPRAAAGAVAVEREAALGWIRIQVRCCCSELRAVRAVPRAHAAATTNQTCLVCSVLAFSVY